MTKPNSVSNAILAIWVTLGISVLSSVAGRALGQISSGAFFGSLFTYGLCAILPYKIGLGRNWARYFYAILMGLGFAAMLAGERAGLTNIDVVISWLLLPVEAWIIFSLFKREVGEWFEGT